MVFGRSARIATHLFRVIALEDAIMGRVVDDDEHRMIGEGADAEGGEQGRPPIGKAEPSKASRDRGLSDHDGKRDRRRHRVVPDQGL